MDTRLLQILNNREQNYPHALEKQFPAVFAKIMSLWDSPEIEALFPELLIKDDSGRDVYPQEVASDILYLSMVHSRLKGLNQLNDPWKRISDAKKQEIEQLGVLFSPQGFFKATELGKRDAITLFLSAGVNVDTVDERLWTPLMVSAFNGDEETANLLIGSGANIHHNDNAGYTPLHWASLNGFSKVAKLLLVKRAGVNSRSKHGWTPLMQAASRGHLSVCLSLFDFGADVNSASADGSTALHKATANGHLPVVKLLLSKNANVKAKHQDGTAALDLAIKYKHQEILTLLSSTQAVP